MRQRPSLTAIVLVIAVLISQDLGPSLQAQAALPTPQQLDQLLAPVALYPDSLLAQITTASTDPQEILDVDNWLQQNPGLTGTALTDAAQQHGFDPAFIALVTFPQVLGMMAENVDDYAAIGKAFLADQASVTASIQRLRAQAYASGALRSNSQQQVEVQQAAGQPIYVIQPANPQVVYVPQYDPAAVYVGPRTGAIVATSLISFGAGIAIGALLVNNQPWGWGGWGWNWGSRRVYYNHAAWGRWGNPYRPPNHWYHPRPVLYNGRPGYGGNWHYRPPNYRPPVPVSGRPGNRPPWGPNNRPGGSRPPAPRPKPQPRPTPQNPRPSNPQTRPAPQNPQPSKPRTRPTPQNPQPSKPQTRPAPQNPRRSKPQTRPTPHNPQPSKPQTRPAPQNPRPQKKPASQSRPAPRPQQNQ